MYEQHPARGTPGQWGITPKDFEKAIKSTSNIYHQDQTPEFSGKNMQKYKKLGLSYKKLLYHMSVTHML